MPEGVRGRLIYQTYEKTFYLRTRSIYAKTIFHEKSSSRLDTAQKWVHPDIVGVQFEEFKNDATLSLLKATEPKETVHLYSYELKKKIESDYPENNYMNYNQFFNQYQQSNPQKKKIVRPNSAYVISKKYNHPLNNQRQEQNNVNEDLDNFEANESQKISMFEQYYKTKNENKDYQMNPNYYNVLEKRNQDNQIKEPKYNIKESDNDEQNNNTNINNIQENENADVSRPIKRPNKEINQPKDYIESNKHLISKIQEANNSNKLKEYNNKKENPYHKEYGKTPKYIQEMRLENEKKIEMEKLRKETAKYPKGTRLLSEEERLFTLEKLKQSRDDINKVIEKLPITSDTQAFRNKKEELFKKLDEIENAIDTFSKKKVFVKVEDK